MVRTIGTLALAFALPAIAASARGLPTGAAQRGNTRASERSGDIPDLVVVAERTSLVTTAYTRSHRGQWGDIADLMVLGTAPLGWPIHR